MPHINRIRVNNVKYNFGTQSYEDFMLKPFGRNMLYDLANGGGKSVLMLLMLQNVLPNCTLDEKQPVEKLFRTGDGSQTIHSLIEWELDESDVVNGFRYMTTGFCARRAQNSEEGGRETASIEYFNYCIFYREYNANDICNLPLVKNREKITYGGLRRYLKELEHDNSLVVRLFDRKGEYQSFIADYGLYESEWEIIRGINRTEGHVRAYFETNYRTTRKVVEDLLIEEIIQKSFRARGGGQDADEAMSRALLEMKDRLLELSRKKSEIGNFDRQIELIGEFAERVEDFGRLYTHLAGLGGKIDGLYRTAGSLAVRGRAKQQDAGGQLIRLERSLRELQERIDAARYCEERAREKRLEKEMKRLAGETETERALLDRSAEALRLKEAMNDYLEYRQEKAKRDETAAELAAMNSEKSALLQEIRFLTHHAGREFAERKKLISGELAALETRCRSLRIRRREMDEQERCAAAEAAVYRTKAEELKRQQERISARIAENRRQVGLLLLEESKSAGEELSGELALLLERKEQSAARIAALRQEMAGLEAGLLECRLRTEQLGRQEEVSEEFFSGYEEQKEYADKLLEVYGARDYARLRELLRERDAKLRIEHRELEEQQRELAARAELLASDEWGSAFGELPETARIREYIAARHGKKVQTGREYLAGQKEETRKELLSEYPFLPCALVVDGGMDELYADAGLRGSAEDGRVFPIVKEAALRNRRPLAEAEDIRLFSQDYTKLLDEGAAKRERTRVSAGLADAASRLSRLEDTQKTCRGDEDFLSRFLLGYEERLQENRKKLGEYEERRRELAEREKELQNRRDAAAAECSRCGKELSETDFRMEEIRKDQATLELLEQDFAKQQELEEELSRNEQNQEAGKQKHAELSQNLRMLEEEQERTDGRRDALRAELSQMDHDWAEKYQRYDVPGEYGECALTGAALEAELNGKRQAYERENSQADDKNRLLQSYAAAMNRCLRAIDVRGVSLARLNSLRESHELYATPEQELTAAREESAKKESEFAKKRRELERVTAEWNQLHGKAGQVAAELSERYGSARELNLKEEEIEEYIENSRSRIGLLSEEADRLKRLQQEYADEERILYDIRKEIERMARAGRLELAEDAGAAEGAGGTAYPEPEGAAALRERFFELEQEYDRSAGELKKRREDFDRGFRRLTDMLTALDAAPLAGEMSGSTSMPENAQETEQLVKNLREVAECLALEKSRVETGIRDMIVLKDNFEDQCLQRCTNIRAELDRLPKLSKITLHGEPIPIISLQIPYVRKELHKEKMSEYIDEIVANADRFPEAEERLRYIRGALSFKKLFSVIVTDMNDIRLSLYKRERIREQSRHLRYEEAVGSTGQSQGIYIQFLIAVISYITHINSGRSDERGLFKVIFIDNPFGAAKDVYIWEPIFELLRANQVQLIVPARGATPAITGRFDVNYILGQKLIDGRQQTVVVDYRSSTETEQLEYIPLQYEQESFDFI